MIVIPVLIFISINYGRDLSDSTIPVVLNFRHRRTGVSGSISKCEKISYMRIHSDSGITLKFQLNGSVKMTEPTESHSDFLHHAKGR